MVVGSGLLVAAAAAFAVVGPDLWPKPKEDFLTCQAQLNEFNLDITERGELESSASLEIRCEVESKNGSGTKILEIVPEGTTVKEGDLLIRFDDSGLKNDRTLQEIAVNSAQAAVTQAKNELDSTEFAKREYELGTFPQEKQKAESELFTAKENLERAEEKLAYKRRMARKGFANAATVDAEFLATAKSRRELEAAETKLRVLDEYTKVKTLRKHDTDIDTANAKVAAETAKLKLETEKLALIDEQIGKCLVNAPRGGQVIYDHSQDRWGGGDHIIKEGAMVYRRRVVLRMPDAACMQVKAKIPESKVDRLKEGMVAEIEVEGLPDVKLQGVVKKVNPFPAEGNWFNSSVKQYETTIDIPDPPPGLRPGMTAEVAIRAEHIAAVVQVPLQAVAEVNGGHYCLQIDEEGGLVPRPVVIGSVNDTHLVIRDGLTDGNTLLLDPRPRLADWETLPPPLLTQQKEQAEPTDEPAAEADQAPAPATPAAGSDLVQSASPASDD
ncbi:MAG: HlyD family efflux transporter periplasmic adaptor subunit [Planctomycetaceae bacterium]|nr:HlyD family efflux transporter periplasmic adaptor subunit [Planctomycetaceae bacterium]